MFSIQNRDRARIGVLIVDEQGMFAEGLARLLTDQTDIQVLGIAMTADQAEELVMALDPDVVLVDYLMPIRDGVAITEAIKRRSPDVKVLMLTDSTDDRVLLAAVEAGCIGYLTKARPASEVAVAVRKAAAGEVLISARDLGRLLPRLNPNYRPLGSDVTEREREILVLLARGWTNATIARELYLSVNTVRNYVQSIITKLGAHSKLEAVAKGVREHVIDYPSTPSAA